MNNTACIEFLQWALPHLGLRWPGFRKVRGQVCKRINRRLRRLGITSLNDYRRYLEVHPQEWEELDHLCNITISRFFRDRSVFTSLEQRILPELARRHSTLNIWSAGCAAGEEPYSLALLWQMRLARAFPTIRLAILGTERDPHMRQRAERACYQASSLKEVPQAWRDRAFVFDGREYCLRPAYRQAVTIAPGDIRQSMPRGPFHLILCRNLVFTYFDRPQQQALLAQIRQRLTPDGRLVIGSHEDLPPETATDWAVEARAIFRPR